MMKIFKLFLLLICLSVFLIGCERGLSAYQPIPIVGSGYDMIVEFNDYYRIHDVPPTDIEDIQKKYPQAQNIFLRSTGGGIEYLILIKDE